MRFLLTTIWSTISIQFSLYMYIIQFREKMFSTGLLLRQIAYMQLDHKLYIIIQYNTCYFCMIIICYRSMWQYYKSVVGIIMPIEIEN